MENSFYVEKADAPDGLPLQFSAHIQECEGARMIVHAHIHDYIEVLYTLSGSYRILLNNRDYSFGKGDLVLINSNEIHRITALSEGLNQYIVVKFLPDMLYTSAQSFLELKYLLPFILNESRHQKIFNRQEIEDTVIPKAVRTIYQEYADQHYGYELAIRANIYSLFLYILRSWNARNMDLNIRQPIGKDLLKRLNGVLGYIESNCQEDITAGGMAAMCHLSCNYFSRVFKAIMKRNFKDYLNFVRIAKAEKLLTTSELNITEIALATGYTTSSYFIHQFRKYKGIAPKQYRGRYRDDLLHAGLKNERAASYAG